jgi:SAM-dependent methyltransferase
VETDFKQNAAFHDELAPRYDAHVTNNACNVLAREAFVDLVSRCVSPGSVLLDFGCGTGLDALRYARKGYRVLAYDHSAGMIAELKQRCKREIASGKITAWSEPYPSFLARFPLAPAPSAVVADFAVLNSIQDLAPLFETFAPYLAPPGWVISSLLNPLHWLKLKTPGWCVKALRERNESPVYSAAPYTTYMHFEQALLRSARRFHLAGRGNSGMFVRYDEGPPGSPTRSWWGEADSNRKRLARMLWQTPAHRMLGHFVFLVLRRDA